MKIVDSQHDLTRFSTYAFDPFGALLAFVLCSLHRPPNLLQLHLLRVQLRVGHEHFVLHVLPETRQKRRKNKCPRVMNVLPARDLISGSIFSDFRENVLFSRFWLVLPRTNCWKEKKTLDERFSKKSVVSLGMICGLTWLRNCSHIFWEKKTSRTIRRFRGRGGTDPLLGPLEY